MTLETLALFFTIIVGLCMGSFYNVVILRGLSGESIAFPGSKCPKCGKALKWWHNIPVLSYILLGGKCGFCKTGISIQYPIIELTSMGLFLSAFFQWGIDIKTIFIWGFFSLFLITAVTDLKERVILTRHAYFLLALGLAYSIFAYFNPAYSLYQTGNPIFLSLLGILAAILIMETLAWIGYPFARQRAFGEGDTYIAAALGAIFGWKYILFVLLAGFIIQFILSLPLFLFNLCKNGKTRLAIELILFLVLAGLMWFFSPLIESIIYIAAMVLIIIMALHLIRGVLADIKTPSKLTYLPYVPALVLASFVAIFVLF